MEGASVYENTSSIVGLSARRDGGAKRFPARGDGASAAGALSARGRSGSGARRSVEARISSMVRCSSGCGGSGAAGRFAGGAAGGAGCFALRRDGAFAAGTLSVRGGAASARCFLLL